jgi:hypothetical protein
MPSPARPRRRSAATGFGLIFVIGALALSAAPAFAQGYGEGYMPATREGAGEVPMVDPDMAAAITGLIEKPAPS